MRIGEDIKRRAIELDRHYRSTWDARAIAHVVGISSSTVAKILREVRGPRPKRGKRQHARRTRFLKRDVMWSSDFVRLGWGWLLLKTIDERSGYILGWDLVRSESALALIGHAESILERMGRAPLVWKFDHGSAFMSEMFLGLLEHHEIVPYPIAPRSPWVNGRTERDHQEIHQWLIPLQGLPINREGLDREIDECMLTRNYIKPRACLGFRRSAEVYFSEEEVLDPVGGMRSRLKQGICEAKNLEGVGELARAYTIEPSGERAHRKAVREVLQKLGLYEEWEVDVQGKPSGAGVVNRTGVADVAF